MNPKQHWKETEKERVYRHMKTLDPSSKEYKELLCAYERLCAIDNSRNHVSMDALATIAANLLGIGLILKYEELNVISTKALNFVIRGRL